MPEKFGKNADFIAFETLFEAASMRNPRADRDFLKKAYDYAEMAHRGQKRDEGCPYFIHPCRVAIYIAEKMEIGDETIIAASLLHDVLEDCGDICRNEMAGIFGEEVVGLVETLTKPDKKLYNNNRGERLRIYHERIRQSSLAARIIKVADRLDNLRFLHLTWKPGKITRYLKETEEVYLPLALPVFEEAAGEMSEIINRFKEQDRVF